MSMVSGGKTLHLPGITKKIVAEGGSKTPVQSAARKRFSDWIAVCFIIVPLIAVSFFVNLYYQNLVNDARSQAVGSVIGDGYKMSTAKSAMIETTWPAIVIWFAITALVFVILLVFTNVVEKSFPLTLFITFALALFALFGPDLFAHPVSKDSDSFADWAKEKYSLSSIDNSTSSSLSSYFNAKEADGQPVRMNVYQTPENVIYLYRSEKELMDILSKNIDAKSNS